MSLPYKILELLNAEQLGELETFSREPGRTVDEVREWMHSRGFEISRNGVWGWLSDFKRRLMQQRYSASSEVARAIRDQANKDGGAVAISEGSLIHLSQRIFQTLEESECDAGELLKLALALKTTLASKQTADDIRAEEKTKQQAAVAEAEKAAGKGASATDVVATIKKSLGIAAA